MGAPDCALSHHPIADCRLLCKDTPILSLHCQLSSYAFVRQAGIPMNQKQAASLSRLGGVEEEEAQPCLERRRAMSLGRSHYHQR